VVVHGHLLIADAEHPLAGEIVLGDVRVAARLASEKRNAR